ncbi:unnamed protein product [Sphacelaria rigidula]
MTVSSSTTLMATVTAMLAAATTTQALTVTTPSEGMVVPSGSTYPVEWTGASADARFEIDLTYCGSYSFCFDDNCGFLLESLCPDEEAGCTQDADGGYDVMMPEPLGGESGGGYRVRIAEIGGGVDSVRCSDDFFLMASTDVPMTGQVGGPGPSLAVTSPTADSVALSGEEYTVEFDYDNGFGGTVGRFKIDLYASGGNGDCGDWVGSVCDKPDKGCKDSTGNYDIVMPTVEQAGMYSIRVGVFGDDSVYACSEEFEVFPSSNSMPSSSGVGW